MSRPSARSWLLAALAVILLMPVAACSSKPKVEIERAPDVDFSQYQTYRWITEDLVLIQPGVGNPYIRNVDNEKRIRAAVDRELAAKGLKKVEGDQAQLIVAFNVGTKIRYQVQGGDTSLNMVAGPPASVTQGKLTIYVFDRATDMQIWSASTKRDLEPGEDPDAVINTAVAALLAEFPV